MPDNEDGQLGVIFNKEVMYRGLSVTLYPTARPDGGFEIYDDVDEAGNPKSARVQALFDYADAFADEIERRTPAGSLVQNAINNGAVPVMGQPTAQPQPQDVCDRCGGEARWTPYRTIKSGRDAGKSKRSLECANGCKKDGTNYPHTIRWQEGR